MAIILVHDVRDKVQVLLFPCLTPFLDELDLFGRVWVGHWEGAVGTDPADPKSQGYILYPQARALASCVFGRGPAQPSNDER